MKSVPELLTPAEAAARLGISPRRLVEILKAGGYNFVDLTAGQGAKPWGRGRKSWGMTPAQVGAVIDGLTRSFPKPDEPAPAGAPKAAPAGLAAFGHDGKSRLPRVGIRAARPKP